MVGPIGILVVVIASLIGVIAGGGAALLAKAGGKSIPDAILLGGSAFAGTVTLILLMVAAVRGFRSDDHRSNLLSNQPYGYNTGMPRVPPVVTYRPTAGAAYLLAWERLPDHPDWWAHIMWLEYKDTTTLRGTEARVHQNDIQQLSGQDYATVPRRRIAGDPTDPRDPAYKTRHDQALEHARVRQQMQRDEPDF